MIVKNEEDVLARCLDCVKKFADEIIIVDTGSADKTKQVAKKYTDKLYDFHGVMISARLVTFLFPRRVWSIVCGWMRMMW